MLTFYQRYAHDLEKRQQAVRQGAIKRLSRDETHSSHPKIAFPSQDDGASFPGGIPSTFSKRPEEDDAPPAYTVSQATEMMGGSSAAGSNSGYDASPDPQQSLKKRKVPPRPDATK
jgi:hypothetical protein